MDTVTIRNFIEAWLANNAGRVNSVSMQIQKITNDCLEICIDGKFLELGIPYNFFTTCSSDGIISNSDCAAFVVTLTNAKSDESHRMDKTPELLMDLNDKLDRMSSRGLYSFSSVLDSILNAFEKYKSSTGSDGAVSEIDDTEIDDTEIDDTDEEENVWSSDDQPYRMALKRCVVCDKELPFTVSRLRSCDNELCLFSFEVLGLGAEVVQELIQMPLELIDLEISLALAAASGPRDVFEPFPPFLLEKREIRQRSDVLNNGYFENPNNTRNNKNMVALRSIIKSFPSVSKMRLCADEVELKEKLANSWLSTTEGKQAQELGDENFRKEVWQLPYNVLRFILCTNRVSLVFLSDLDDKILKLDSSKSQWYQFAVVQDSPEREVVYSSKNKQESSIFGFHGSLNENWYSILRNGLRCLSNTELMSHGSTSGDGIYLANSFQYSASYADSSLGYRTERWNNGMYNDGLSVVSICEVVSSAPMKKRPGDTFVVPKEQEGNVAVRYLLVYGNDKPDKIPTITICDGHILSQGGDTVDLSQHYQSIRQKHVYG